MADLKQVVLFFMTCATPLTRTCEKAGVAESVIMAITGHSTRAMFDRYNTIDLDNTQQAVDRLQVFLDGVDQTVDRTASDEK